MLISGKKLFTIILHFFWFVLFFLLSSLISQKYYTELKFSFQCKNLFQKLYLWIWSSIFVFIQAIPIGWRFQRLVKWHIKRCSSYVFFISKKSKCWMGAFSHYNSNGVSLCLFLHEKNWICQKEIWNCFNRYCNSHLRNLYVIGT